MVCPGGCRRVTLDGMRSTMMDAPLLVSRILVHGTTVHGASEVVTWAPDGPRRLSYADVGRDAARLAHALRELGITGDQRVGTFMWNNAEHLVAYLAVPSMGAVLHPVNIRLFPEQLVYVINHAEDEVVLVDATLAPAFAALLPQLRSVRHVVLVHGRRRGRRRRPRGPGSEHAQVHDYAPLLEGRPGRVRLARAGRTRRGLDVLHLRDHRRPQGRGLQPPLDVPALASYATSGDAIALRQGDRVLAVVPMFHANAWGLPYAAVLAGASLVLPDRFLQAAPLAALIDAERPTHAGAVPTIWNDLLNHLDANPTDVSSLREVLVGGSACPPALMRGVPGAARRHDRPRLGHDRDVAARHGRRTRRPGSTREEAFAYRVTQGRLAGPVEARLVGPDGSVQPWDGKSVGELEVRGPWVTGSYYRDPDPGEVRRRLAADRRRRRSQPERLPHA